MIELNRLYEEIHNCHICPNMDKFKELRNVSAVTLKTNVFIISQALAENQLRFSGVNFFTLDGLLGSTGKQLEKFLNFFNQTVFPPQEIILKNGAKIQKHNDTHIPVYNTEITQCFPGKGIKGDRKPDTSEIKNCLEKNFLFNEIKIIKPKLLLLMGRLSIKTFYKFILGNEPNISTNEMIDNIVSEEKVPECDLDGNKIGFLPIHHASGANNRYYPKMLKNLKLIKLVKGFLNE